MRSRIGTVIWIVIGVVIASSHHYLDHIGAVRPIISAAQAILLWPLLLLGINLHVH
jgi:hypothetical protein